MGQECEAHRVVYWTAAKDGELFQVQFANFCYPATVVTKPSFCGAELSLGGVVGMSGIASLAYCVVGEVHASLVQISAACMACVCPFHAGLVNLHVLTCGRTMNRPATASRVVGCAPCQLRPPTPPPFAQVRRPYSIRTQGGGRGGGSGAGTMAEQLDAAHIMVG